MRSPAANADSRLSLWRRVREYAVPPSMIEAATTRRRVGDWAGACAAARVDVDLDLRAVARRHGRDMATRLRADLRHLAPDLLRWHMPRVAPDGLLRPGLTVSLARYGPAEHADAEPVHLVARTAPGWADAGQRIRLALWDASRDEGDRPHPHARPDRRFRLDLHRHLWDARRAEELRSRSGVPELAAGNAAVVRPDPPWDALRDRGYAVHRWAAEAAGLLQAEGRTSGAVVVRIGPRRRLVLDVIPPGPDPRSSPAPRIAGTSRAGGVVGLPVLPDAATWMTPDLELLRNGLIEVDRLHPLVASALAPGQPAVPTPPEQDPDPAATPRLVACRGDWHRIGLVNGVLQPLDHDPAEIRREELLAALTGTPLPCLRAIDEAHRRPECLPDIRARLDHGDTAGALATVEALLGPDALLRSGDLREELETAASRRITYGLFRAGLIEQGPPPCSRDWQLKRGSRAHPRHTTAR
ncbi:hypothetical protein [Micromonospora sp. NBRC 101691]|uniref:hypothetical protein n=1 Tax=Micromonospora sp. NBRC 101691 TaxID=3032198 RepID=UPI0024A492DA|nr:hypothetical protein [Micromonospora sp. NBRC 101691]GLY25981.1 hypothetical protein Misp04_57120 [Micromonospora sp. NBRC 101691]